MGKFNDYMQTPSKPMGSSERLWIFIVLVCIGAIVWAVMDGINTTNMYGPKPDDVSGMVDRLNKDEPEASVMYSSRCESIGLGVVGCKVDIVDDWRYPKGAFVRTFECVLKNASGNAVSEYRVLEINQRITPHNKLYGIPYMFTTVTEFTSDTILSCSLT